MGMKMIGLTGGIGSGKTTVAALFKTLGIPVYESDARARTIMNSSPELTGQIQQLLGPAAYQNGEINRAWVAEQVFGQPPLLEALNAIVHPAVIADALQWANSAEQASSPYVIKESAILFEEHLTAALDGIILVVAPELERIDRVMKRDRVTRSQVEERMRYQWKDDDKIPLADYVIFNDGNRSLIDQVVDIDRMIRIQ
jgi:dephospho-CoA kinase